MKKIDIDRRRHLMKAVTWRIVGSLDTILWAWIITGKLSFGLKIGLAELLSKILLYYLHERAWIRIGFGIKHREPKPEDEK